MDTITQKTRPVKIGCVGDIRFEDKRQIKELIFKMKKKYPNLKIFSGGRKYGADKYIKKYALEFEIPYSEFNPECTAHNLYSFFPVWHYNKPYNFKFLLKRNKIMAKEIDAAIIFQYKKTDNDIVHFIKCMEESGKNFKILN